MAEPPEAFPPSPSRTVSLDTWAVGVALILAFLVRLGIIQKVPW